MQFLPARCRTESQASESFLRVAGRNRKPGKLPAHCRTESQAGKASCALQDEIASRESFLRIAGRNPRPGKLPAHCRTKSQASESFLRVAGRNPKLFAPARQQKGKFRNRLLIGGHSCLSFSLFYYVFLFYLLG